LADVHQQGYIVGLDVIAARGLLPLNGNGSQLNLFA
jgi:hypothetical protein